MRQSDWAADLQRAQAADAHLAEAGWTQQTYVLTTVVSHIRDEDDLDSDQVRLVASHVESLANDVVGFGSHHWLSCSAVRGSHMVQRS